MEKRLEPKNVRLRPDRFDYRIIYEKKSTAKYISHLDLMRTMQRAIKRSKLPVWYTQGFNPHIYITFPLTLPLGFESECEIMDFSLLEKLDCEQVKNELDKQLPNGMKIISCTLPINDQTQIKYAQYQINFSADRCAKECFEFFNEFLKKEKIEIEKRTKKKQPKLVNIRPYINVKNICVEGEKTYIDVILPAGGEFSLNANVVMETFFNMFQIVPEEICIKRTKIMLQNGENFT